MFRKLITEPLLHFLLIGAALFYVYGQLNENDSEPVNLIVISPPDVERMVSLWQKTWQRPPTKAEIEGLIEQHIREEVLYREALAMGLDKNDTIVRRRMAQKVEFISSDIADQANPTEEQLETYLANNQEKFTIPARISFSQVYLNPDLRGARVEEDATLLLAQLSELEEPMEIHTLGDPFLLDNRYEDLTPNGVSRLFGRKFADQLFALDPGAWQGPHFSGYGLHILRIEAKTPPRQPELATVRDQVAAEWQSTQRKKLDKAFYQALRQRYDIVVQKTNDAAETK